MEVSAPPAAIVAERIATPGAVTSGFTWPKPATGPRELKSAMAGSKESDLLIRICWLDAAPNVSEPMSDFKYSPLALDMPSTWIGDLRTVAAVSSPLTLL